MTLKKGNVPGENGTSSETPITNEELQKAIKSYADQVTQLQRKLDEMAAAGPTASTNKTVGGTNASDILALADAITKQTKKDINYEEGIDLSQIPADDYIDQKDWIRFCVPSGGYVISDDRRKGHVVKLPFGKQMIFFEHLLTNRRAVGKHTVTTPVATYTCKSKKEAEWIREHTLYGTFIFEDVGQVPGTTAEKALRLHSIMKTLTSLDFANVISQGKALGVPFNANPDEMVKQVAIAACEKEFEQLAMANGTRATEAWKEKALLGQAQ